MSRAKLNIFHRDQIIAGGVSVADSFWNGFSGYMLRRKPHVSGILFEPSGSIQTTFMRFSLDVVFLGSTNRVVKICRDLRPWKFASSPAEAGKVLELPAGNLPLTVKEGDVLDLKKE